MGCIVSWGILDSESHRQPSLFDFGVGVSSCVIISINSGKKFKSDIVLVCLESVVEDNFQVGVEGEVVFVVGWAGLSTKSEIGISELGGIVSFFG